MSYVAKQDARRLMKADIDSKREPKYKRCPKCRWYNEFQEKKGTPTNPIDYKGTHTCRICGEESTIAEWRGIDLEDL